MSKSLGQIAFEAYNNAGANPGLTWDKKPVPTWENLSDDVRTKWESAAVAVTFEASASAIGYRIRALRRNRKLTLEDTAKAMVCTIPEASGIERDKRGPNGEQLHALEKLFNEMV